MTHNFKPGDVALVRSMYDTEVIGLRTGVPSNMGWAYSMDVSNGPGPGGSSSTQTWSADADGERVIRPLVVIDPEDREQIERLMPLLFHSGAFPEARAISMTAGVTAVQAALRELANPTPRIEEPTGLGAVVATEGDGDYIRVSVELLNPWLNVQTGTQVHWDRINAIRVLSPGVEVSQ